MSQPMITIRKDPKVKDQNRPANEQIIKKISAKKRLIGVKDLGTILQETNEELISVELFKSILIKPLPANGTEIVGLTIIFMQFSETPTFLREPEARTVFERVLLTLSFE